MKDVRLRYPHWDGDTRSLVQLQQRLARQLVLTPLPQPPRFIAGADVSCPGPRSAAEPLGWAVILVLDYATLEPVAHASSHERLAMPYLPGLLSFREIPLLLTAWRRLPLLPDLVMLDGQGILHPRRLGLAAHFGLLIQRPTLGCAKTRLTGDFDEPASVADSSSAIYLQGEVAGYALRSKARCRPLLISPGHGMTPEDALAVTRHCLAGYRLPEPTRLAHAWVNRFRRGEPLTGPGPGT